jgi:autophagy-related protein 16
MASLESQISSLRDELATVYKTQGQNAQRLLSMNETLREKEELSRVDTDNLRKAREDVVNLRRKVEQHNELMAEKDRTAQVSTGWLYLVAQTGIRALTFCQILHDEINTLQLELGQIEERNATLSKDNAKLLQRWLDAKQAEANKVNEANDFYEDMRSRHQSVLNWRDGSQGDANSGGNNNNTETQSVSQGSVSGNGDANEEVATASTKGGTPSPAKVDVDLTPNG